MTASEQPSIDQRIQWELLRNLYSAHGSSGLGAVLVITVFCGLFYWRLRDDMVWVWAGVLYAGAAIVFGWYARFHRDSEGPRPLADWLRSFHAVQAIGGASWGMAPWLFAPADDLPTNAVLVVAVMGLASASQGTLSFVRHGMTSFAAPMMLGISIALLRDWDALHMVLAFFVLAHMLLAIKQSNDQYLLLSKALKVRIQNETLAQRLTEQMATTERTSQAKTHFLATASHDLRQPLHALALMGSALERRLQQKDPEEARRAGDMLRAVDALGTSLNAMLDISRLDAGVMEPIREPTALNMLFIELQRLFAPDAEAKELALRFRATSLVVDSDPQLLMRLLSNLIDNALKYTRHGGVVVVARCRAAQVWVDVFDTGPGIAVEQTERIFDEYYQVDNQGRDRSRGLGLGLSIVRRIEVLLGIHVELLSQLGRGSRFRVVLPLSATKQIASPKTAPPREAKQSRTKKVLILDDEESIRVAMLELLTSHGIATHAAADEATASALLLQAQSAQQPFDMLLIDYRLGDGSNGLQVGQRLLQRYGPELHLLLITGETAPEPLRAIHEQGITVLHKPVAADLLMQAIGFSNAEAQSACIPKSDD